MQALYDAKPSILEAVGNGSYLYRWNIKEVEQPAQDERAEAVTQWECQEVVVWSPLSTNKITEMLINELWNKDYEQKLINEYNSAVLGVYSNEVAEEKINAYKAFLQERKQIKEQINADCLTLGIR